MCRKRLDRTCVSIKLPSCGRLHALLVLAPSVSAPAVLCCSRSSGSFGLCATVCRALADMKDKLRQTLGSAQLAAWRSILCGKVLFTNLRSSQGGAFRVGNPYLPIQLAAWRSASCGKFLFTNSTAAFRVGNSYLQTQLERFVWEIPIYKLNCSVSCGKFLFTNSTGAFRVGNFYLQTQLQRFVWEIPIYKLN